MQILNRLEKLEKQYGHSENVNSPWNLANVSTPDLIALRNLIGSDPVKASELQNRLIEAGTLTYEHT